MNSLLAHPDGDDAVAVLLQGHAAVVITIGTPLSTHGSAVGVIAPREGIVATAKEKGCDLIVMASHGRRGVSRLLLGSQAYEVLTHCSVPALIVR